MESRYLEIISDGVNDLAYLIQADWMPDHTQFLTPGTLSLQMGMIVYGAGESITPHVHLPIMRNVQGTAECIVVRKGKCEIDIFNSEKHFIASRTLTTGTIILLLGGGHGFRMTEDTVLFEVKQGPYAGDTDKERF